MLKGMHLSLMIGPAVPRPVSYETIEALTSVEVRTETSKPSTFQLQFMVSKRSKLDQTFMLSGLSPVPIMRVVVTVTINGQPNVLIDGVMTNHQYAPGMQGSSTLTVTGEDLTKLMDLQELSGMPYPAMPPFARVAVILAKYAPLGIIPKVIPNIGSFAPGVAERIAVQRGTDLAYIKCLASEAGYEFYQDPGPRPGMSAAYWGPAIKYGSEQPALTMNMDAHNNIESLNFSFETQQRTMPIAMIQEPGSKLPIPIPVGNISPLNPPMGKVIPPPTKYVFHNRTAKMAFAEAIESSLAIASKSANVVSGNGTLDVLRYGRALQPRKLVGVRGAGTAFDGRYYVEQVTHKIKPGEYKQDFQLSRNAIVPLQNRVAV